MANRIQAAKIFISCGQQPGQERNIAKDIAIELKRLGYAPYIAFEEQTLRGLKENIFETLRDTAYFLFIDFKREKIVDKKEESAYRGSLFSHQELAIASYLDLEILAFQENGIEKLDGLLSVLQVNCISFSTDKELKTLVLQEVKNPLETRLDE